MCSNENNTNNKLSTAFNNHKPNRLDYYDWLSDGMDYSLNTDDCSRPSFQCLPKSKQHSDVFKVNNT